VGPAISKLKAKPFTKKLSSWLFSCLIAAALIYTHAVTNHFCQTKLESIYYKETMILRALF